MNFRTKSYLRKRFGDYYQMSELPLPHDFKRREWGFIFFDEMPEVVMRRHKSFSSQGEALEYLRGMVPAHVYHSAAYYQFPGAGTMKEKKWEGADLIFDLDADHLPQKARSYAEMLANVKSETGKLLDFLLEDFGFTEENIRIAFSGGRGYHIHVHDPRVLTLESAQRREIVDYLSGTGLDTDYIFKSEKKVTHDIGKYKKEEIVSPKRISSFDKKSGLYGWGKRISIYLIHFLKDISTKDYAIATSEIMEIIENYERKKLKHSLDKVSDDIAAQIVKIKNENKKIGSGEIAKEFDISKENVRDLLIVEGMWDFKPDAISKLKIMKKIVQSQEALEMIEHGNIDFSNTTDIFEAIVNKAIQDNSVHLGSGHTDEPVTADIRRLIRMPSSLHGGSGMRVVPLTLAEFQKFEPLRDAVVFSEREIQIEVKELKPQNSLVEMKGKSIKVVEGINTVPEYAGMYLMCRGAAEYA